MRFETALLVVAALFVLLMGLTASITDEFQFYLWLVYWGLLFLYQVDLTTRRRWPTP